MKLLVALAVGISLPTAVNAEPLTFDNGRLFVAATINGVPTEALLDSGAEASLIDPSLAAKDGLAEGKAMTIRGSGGEQQARVVPGARIEALGLKVEPEVVVVLDLGDLSRRLIKRPTMAVVGRELFDAARLRIDMTNNTIDVVSTDVDPGGTRLDLVAHAGIESFPVSVNGQKAQAEFDLGNGSGVMISRGMVKRLGLSATGKTVGGGIGGEIERDTTVLPQLEVAGTVFIDVPASIDDQPNANDLNIGTSVLRHFIVTTDFGKRAIWLQPVQESPAADQGPNMSDTGEGGNGGL